MRFFVPAVLIMLLTGCSTFVPPRYAISVDNQEAMKAGGYGGIAVGPFIGYPNFDNACRGAGPIAPPDDMTFEAYIRKAFIDELKMAGAYAETNPRVTITGDGTSSPQNHDGCCWESSF
jgi:hypothetical protein